MASLWARPAFVRSFHQLRIVHDTAGVDFCVVVMSLGGYVQLLGTNDRMEGLMAFGEKRKPHYTGT